MSGALIIYDETRMNSSFQTKSQRRNGSLIDDCFSELERK